jgi:hypothetical protein
MIGVMGVVRVVHGDDVGQHRRLDVIVVVGRDAHKLGAFDQKRGMSDVGDAHLIGIERGEIERRRNRARLVRRHQSRTVLRHLGFGRRRLGLLRMRT